MVLVVYRDLALEVRCSSYQSFMLPTLGGYIREVALFALCCSCLLIAAPAWIIYFTFVILRSVCWFLFFFFFFIRYLAGRGFTANLQDPSLQLMVPPLVDIVLESSAANTAYKYSNGWRR